MEQLCHNYSVIRAQTQRKGQPYIWSHHGGHEFALWQLESDNTCVGGGGRSSEGICRCALRTRVEIESSSLFRLTSRKGRVIIFRGDGVQEVVEVIKLLLAVGPENECVVHVADPHLRATARSLTRNSGRIREAIHIANKDGLSTNLDCGLNGHYSNFKVICGLNGHCSNFEVIFYPQ